MIDPRVFWSSLLGSGLGVAVALSIFGAVIWVLLAA
jgi:hypothetical protein